VRKAHKQSALLPKAAIQPAFDSWISLAEKNVRLARKWQTCIASIPIGELRRVARDESVALACEFSRRMGVPLTDPGSKASDGLVVMCGAAPELYHPGIWSKVFMIQAFATRYNALAIDIVVDTDRFSGVSVQVPKVIDGQATGLDIVKLESSSSAEYFSASPVPEPDVLESYCADVDKALSALPDLGWRESFSAFRRELLDSAGMASNLAELMTFARRRYEIASGNDYLELPVSMWAATSSFRLYAADIIVSADRYLTAHNDELAMYRASHGLRSAAQPLPDLKRIGDLCELPFWMLKEGKRLPVFSRKAGKRVHLFAGEELIADELSDVDSISRRLLSIPLAPKALALTIFARMLLADIFVHGTGGSRYDQIADRLMIRYYGIEPPEFAVVSVDANTTFVDELEILTDQLLQAKIALKRFRHHPETGIGIDCGVSADDLQEICALVQRKKDTVDAIQQTGAEKALLGRALKELNAEIAAKLKPVEASLTQRVDEIEARLMHLKALSDRNYPYCFFDPRVFRDTLW